MGHYLSCIWVAGPGGRCISGGCWMMSVVLSKFFMFINRYIYIYILMYIYIY